MAVESDSDRMIFLNPDDFGVEAVYEPRNGGGSVPVAGIFDNEHKPFDPNRWPGTDYQQQMGAHFSSTVPSFVCRTTDLPDRGKQRSKLTVEGRVYKVHDVKPDGTGITVLLLTEEDA